MRLGRLVRTVIHLQPGQIINRFTRKLPRMKTSVGQDMPFRAAAHSWTVYSPHPISMLSPTRFRFLAEEYDLDFPAQWNDTTIPRLWIYNLHYFDDLLGRFAEERAPWHYDLMKAWIRHNPPHQGAGWEPYPLSRRVVNWVVAALSGAVLPTECRESLLMQARELRRSLEYHLRGNHLFVNAKALIFLGCVFEGKEAAEWLSYGLRLLKREVAEQVLADGAHFERSPMYHALLLEDMLDLIQLGQLFPSLLAMHQQDWCATAASMLGWLAAISHPDGEIGLFNDAAFHEARNISALCRYAEALGIKTPDENPKSAWMKESGYIRLVDGPWTVLFDVAPVGPSYIPGHAHADTLSFELSFEGKRFITNGGTSTYENNPLRWAERATSSHATVEVDGENSSEVWASFRVGRRARPGGVTFTNEGKEAHAWHDGYRFLAGKPLHKRRISVTDQYVSVSDEIVGSAKHDVVGRFPLHPDIQVERQVDFGWLLRTACGRQVKVQVEGASSCGLAEGHLASEFGVRLPRKILTWQKTTPSAPVVTKFELISK